MTLRSLVERATHRFVLRRRLPREFGRLPLYVSSEGGLRYLAPLLSRVDPILLSLATELVEPGSTVWDVGANLGLFSFAAAARAGPRGRVLAIEPDLWLAHLLRRSASRSAHRANVDVLPVAVSDRPGLAEFLVASRSRAANHLAGFGSSQSGGIREHQLVATTTLDHLAAEYPKPRLLKIDVEEAEGRVLAGGRALIRDARPTILCEVAEGNTALVASLMNELGYETFDGGLAPPRTPTETPAYLTVAFPSDRVSRLNQALATLV